MTQPFLNPWPFTQKEKEATNKVCKAVITYIPLNIDAALFKSIRFLRTENSGTVSTTVNHLIKKLYDECQRRGITDFTRVDEFENFVLNSVLRLPDELAGGTVGRVDAKTTPLDDGRGTESGGGTSANNSVVDTNAQSGSVVEEKRAKVRKQRKAVRVVQ